MPPTTLVDARWSNHAGATTVTRLLLRGLAEVAPPGRWLLWGPGPMVGAGWPGAIHVPTGVNPVAWFGQRSVLSVPRADFALHLHQTRPIHRIPTASLVHDLIQLDEPAGAIRIAKALRLRASVRAAEVLFTVAPSVRDRLVADLGVDARAVTVLELPVDAEAALRVANRRSSMPSRGYLLAVGRFDRHKNLPRLVEAFTRTRFASSGGQLHLLGGTSGELAALGLGALPAGVRVLGVVDQAGLEDALVGAIALVQASLAEGYGLPVTEALLAMVPVVSSPVPAVTEWGPAGVPTFDPRSVSAISEAIDETVELAEHGRYWERVDYTAWANARPTTRTFAERVLAGLAKMADAG